ncbi:MAG: hypothetical protein JW892_03740 [Anaerolineae bacterium]|nr:hypothetical protein [Anaerolineae bacterium]
MNKSGKYGLGLLLALLLTSCTLPLAPTVPSPSPTLTATVTPPPTETPTPLPTPTPEPTPTPTLIPPPDPTELPALAEAGAARLRAAVGDAELVCFRHEDLTNDGLPEWLALLHQPEANRMSAFVLQGDNTITTLLDAKPDPGKPYYGLGQYPTCEIEIRDINADGRTEIAIFGHAERNLTLLHLYAWNANDFRLVGAFQGDAGVFFEDRDGDLAEEILEGHRDTGAPQLAWRVIFTWDGLTYGWTWDRWDWYFLERPHSYPTHRADYAVISFYLALNDRDLPGAYALLADSARAAQPYEAWATGFARTLRVDVSGIQRVAEASDENQARVNAMVTAWDNDDGLVTGRLWEVTWETVLTEAGWRLVAGTTNLLDTWDARYWK